MQTDYDVTVLGAGIVGLATAMELSRRFPRARIGVLEKEPRSAVHQTGHNSGVIHSGIYYRPGSLKARLCVAGAQALTTFCQRHGIPYQLCGKLVIATSEEELPRLQELYARGQANGVPGLTLLKPDQFHQREPHATGLKALVVPSAGIVDFTQVAGAFARILQQTGGEIHTDHRVVRIAPADGALILQTPQREIRTAYLINCAGLWADRMARCARVSVPLQIIPFRGEYFELIPSRRHLVRGLIYPVRDPRLPFLGVHLTRTIDNRVEAGPNAVVALHREGYRKTDWSLRDTAEILTYPGFWRMSARYWRTGLAEWIRSLSKAAFVRSIQRLVPALQAEDLVPAEAGVRAQALDRRGTLLDDFCLIQRDRSIHVCNAPSPAATASIAIGEFIAEAAAKQFNLTA